MMMATKASSMNRRYLVEPAMSASPESGALSCFLCCFFARPRDDVLEDCSTLDLVVAAALRRLNDAADSATNAE